ncbi:hypothetical protein CYMTET_44995 [Cymbomonas tetramitiformis]|uniref:Uncharacterized protein n=1 Tax=Cymbomonas tetramitiformis TaxID=36881 RepID=A0AAE0C0T6_9CHLO|nr:hypothetical protein CYMTET_44995 [Cymbomonas tetramitiformis]
MYKALSLYQAVNKPSWALSDDPWVGAAEVEATLCITKTTTTCCQYEKVFAGAYGALIKGATMHNLRAGYLDIVDVQKVSKTGGLPRIRKYDLSALGQQCVKRATLEGERRFCGNVTEELTGAGVEMSDRELQATLLDLRTVQCAHVTKEQRDTALQLLKKQYVAFGAQCLLFDRQEAATAAELQASRKQKAAALEPTVASSATTLKVEKSVPVLCGYTYGSSGWDDVDVLSVVEEQVGAGRYGLWIWFLKPRTWKPSF